MAATKRLQHEVDKALRETRATLNAYDARWQDLRDLNSTAAQAAIETRSSAGRLSVKGKKNAVRAGTQELLDLKHARDNRSRIEWDLAALLRRLHRFKQSVADWLSHSDLKRKEEELRSLKKALDLRYKRGKAFYTEGKCSDVSIGEPNTNGQMPAYYAAALVWVDLFLAELRRQRKELKSEVLALQTVHQGVPQLQTVRTTAHPQRRSNRCLRSQTPPKSALKRNAAQRRRGAQQMPPSCDGDISLISEAKKSSANRKSNLSRTPSSSNQSIHPSHPSRSSNPIHSMDSESKHSQSFGPCDPTARLGILRGLSHLHRLHFVRLKSVRQGLLSQTLDVSADSLDQLRDALRTYLAAANQGTVVVGEEVYEPFCFSSDDWDRRGAGTDSEGACRRDSQPSISATSESEGEACWIGSPPKPSPSDSAGGGPPPSPPSNDLPSRPGSVHESAGLECPSRESHNSRHVTKDISEEAVEGGPSGKSQAGPQRNPQQDIQVAPSSPSLCSSTSARLPDRAVSPCRRTPSGEDKQSEMVVAGGLMHLPEEPSDSVAEASLLGSFQDRRNSFESASQESGAKQQSPAMHCHPSPAKVQSRDSLGLQQTSPRRLPLAGPVEKPTDPIHDVDEAVSSLASEAVPSKTQLTATLLPTPKAAMLPGEEAAEVAADVSASAMTLSKRTSLQPVLQQQQVDVCLKTPSVESPDLPTKPTDCQTNDGCEPPKFACHDHKDHKSSKKSNYHALNEQSVHEMWLKRQNIWALDSFDRVLLNREWTPIFSFTSNVYFNGDFVSRHYLPPLPMSRYRSGGCHWLHVYANEAISVLSTAPGGWALGEARDDPTRVGWMPDWLTRPPFARLPVTTDTATALCSRGSDKRPAQMWTSATCSPLIVVDAAIVNPRPRPTFGQPLRHRRSSQMSDSTPTESTEASTAIASPRTAAASPVLHSFSTTDQIDNNLLSIVQCSIRGTDTDRGLHWKSNKRKE